ncbi:MULTISPECIES: pilin subunit UpsB [Metallosphaera]|uniref:pilin subunit UpsB n=1 Tax=Metallosphaera TaxID=41980 RepID=UPI00064E3340
MTSPKSKALSEFFSVLIVTLIILSLSLPLLYYFNRIVSTQKDLIGNEINNEIQTLNIKVKIIVLGNASTQVYIYNYGSNYLKVQEIINGSNVIETDYPLEPGSLVPLSSILGNITVNRPLLVEINGSLYVIN